MMNCKEATRMVSEGLDRELALGEKFRLRLHLLICDYCRNFSRQGEFLRRAARSAAKRKADD
ncbi:zf-HC2 domain-containing protein [Chitinimonas sp. PSY-7]|uniref:anti-sigma factor family protein n=1 Tax=Chitinimonas sp. PSY-7 TaxID=3459088 RepID=UPI004040028F